MESVNIVSQKVKNGWQIRLKILMVSFKKKDVPEEIGLN